MTLSPLLSWDMFFHHSRGHFLYAYRGHAPSNVFNIADGGFLPFLTPATFEKKSAKK